jgi:hypothetical protein
MAVSENLVRLPRRTLRQCLCLFDGWPSTRLAGHRSDGPCGSLRSLGRFGRRQKIADSLSSSRPTALQGIRGSSEIAASEHPFKALDCGYIPTLYRRHGSASSRPHQFLSRRLDAGCRKPRYSVGCRVFLQRLVAFHLGLPLGAPIPVGRFSCQGRDKKDTCHQARFGDLSLWDFRIRPPSESEAEGRQGGAHSQRAAERRTLTTR